MIKESKLSVSDLMSKDLMIIIKSMQNKIKKVFKNNFYKIPQNKKVPPEKNLYA